MLFPHTAVAVTSKKQKNLYICCSHLCTSDFDVPMLSCVGTNFFAAYTSALDMTTTDTKLSSASVHVPTYVYVFPME